MGTNPSLTILRKDFIKITSLLSNNRAEIAEQLDEELNRADIVNEVPPNTVVMNSVVTFVDVDSGKEQTVQLVYPNEMTNSGVASVSILAPIGAALIGLRVGQTIDWPLDEQRTKRLRVTKVEQS